jgi:flagellar assembly protein FliH
MRLLLNIIKASQYNEMKSKNTLTEESDSPQLSSADLTKNQVRDRHQEIVNEAFKKAKDIVDAAQNYSMNQLKESTMRMNEECAQMRVRSYEDGYSQGLAEGKAEGNDLGYRAGYEEGLKITEEENEKLKSVMKQANEDKLNELSQMLNAVECKKTEILNQFEADIQNLAITIAQKVIKKELSTDEKAMQAIILDVMESYRNQEWVKISVSPNTVEQLTKADSNIVQVLKEFSNNVKIVPSPEMKEGDCQIDLPDRLIDAGTDTQMDRIKAALKL